MTKPFLAELLDAIDDMETEIYDTSLSLRQELIRYKNLVDVIKDEIYDELNRV
jgi:hypothetical protein